MIPYGLGAIFPGMNFAIPGSGPQGTPTPNSYDGRTPYTGSFQTGVDARTDPGNPNNINGQGPTIGPEGVIPYGGMSQLGGRANNSFSGYYTNPTGFRPTFDRYAPDINGAPLSGWPQTPHANEPNPAPSTPHAREPNSPPNLQPMMGQWGGGAWNVGSSAPASMQQMWLGSQNGGQSWGQAPGYNSRAPQYGQTTSMWGQAPNQDADSPTWVQKG